MQLHTINTGLFKLDGGAMFGVVPKKIWHKLVPADENNLCTWAMRCLLIETGNRKILIDCGMGNKQDNKFFSHYEPHGSENLLQSLTDKNINQSEITDVLLTHLHFDHCGGAVTKDEQGKLVPSFSNARYWSNEKHWQWATEPNSRERAPFLKENILPLKGEGVLQFLKEGDELIPGISFIWVNGHTEAMMLPVINYNGKIIVYMADLIPSYAHIPVPYVMGYDIRPLESVKEKQIFLKEAAEKEYILFLEHDETNECCSVEMTDKGVRVKGVYSLSSLIKN